MAGVGIKSKERVKKFGEVYTPDSIVCDMLDGVLAELRKQEEYTNDKFIMETFLEPTCGDGQFLVRILDEKIKAVNEVPEKDRPLALVKAMTTIYGIDIQMDNVLESRERLKKYLFEDEVDTFTFKQDKDEKTGEIKTREFTKIDLEINPELEKCLSNIIDNNILVGDMLDPEMKVIDYTWVGDTAYCKVVLLHGQEYEQISLNLIDAKEFGIKEDKEYTFKFNEIQYIDANSKNDNTEETDEIEEIKQEEEKDHKEAEEARKKEEAKKIKEANDKAKAEDEAADKKFKEGIDLDKYSLESF